MPGTHAIELSVHTLVSLMEQHRLGDPHPVLAGGERYLSPRLAGERIEKELADAGLDDRDRLDQLLNAIEVIQRATTEYYGWVTSGTESWSAVLAGIGRCGTELTRTGDQVTVRPVNAKQLVELIVRQLPDSPVGTGESISVRATDFVTRPAGVVLRHAIRPEDARRLDSLLSARRLGGAKLYAARRDDTGRRVRSREWLTVLDLEAGRWLVYQTEGHGERAINAVPGTARLLAAKLTDLSG